MNNKIKLIVRSLLRFSMIFIAIEMVVYLSLSCFFRSFLTPELLISKVGKDSFAKLIISVFGIVPTISSIFISEKINYNKVVTQSRLMWIKNFKELFSEFFELTVDQANKSQKAFKNNPKFEEHDEIACIKEKMYENSSNIKRVHNSILLELNPLAKEDKEISEQVSKIMNLVSMSSKEAVNENVFKKEQESLTHLVSIYIKNEWEKIKKESR